MLMVAEFSITVWSVTAATSGVGMASITYLHSLLAISTTGFDMANTLKCRKTLRCATSLDRRLSDNSVLRRASAMKRLCCECSLVTIRATVLRYDASLLRKLTANYLLRGLPAARPLCYESPLLTLCSQGFLLRSLLPLLLEMTGLELASGRPSSKLYVLL